jgi:RHS repeat-associated protein
MKRIRTGKTTMTHTRLLAILLALLGAFTALGTPSIEPPRPGEALYLVVLGERPVEPDVTALGGRLIRSWGDRRLVAIPIDRTADLQSQPTVSYIQRVWTGESDTAGQRSIRSETAVPKARVTTSATISTNTAPPQWTTGVYQYDGSGNIKQVGEDVYRYDHVGRLTYSEVKTTLGKAYTYDPYGNLVTFDGAAVEVNAANNRLTSILYDATGNMKEMAGRRYLYDPLGMVTAIDVLVTEPNDLRMIYSADDERIAIDEGMNTTRYRLRGIDNKVLREWQSTGGEMPEWKRDYIYAGGALVAGEVQIDQRRNGMRHYHSDHLGSIRLVTDGAGELAAQHDYEPFGAEITSTKSEFDNTGNTLRDALKFTAHERDYFSGGNLPTDYVDYMHARYYTPKLGRFLSVDPGKDWDPAQPQSWNLYAYVRNNPVTSIDPNGRNGISSYLQRANDRRSHITDSILAIPSHITEVRGGVSGSLSGVISAAVQVAVDPRVHQTETHKVAAKLEFSVFTIKVVDLEVAVRREKTTTDIYSGKNDITWQSDVFTADSETNSGDSKLTVGIGVSGMVEGVKEYLFDLRDAAKEQLQDTVETLKKDQ